jgi:TonB family protein
LPAAHRVAALLLCGFAPLSAYSQTPAQTPAPAATLPAAPSPEPKPSPSIFTVPSSTAQILAASGSPAPTTHDEQELCYAPAKGIYAPQPKPDAKLEAAIQRYVTVAQQSIVTTWYRGMPRAAKDPWLKRATVVIRFAILPDGSIDPPLITASSGRHSYDQHALDAIQQTSPFDPLPAGDAMPVRMCIHFAYHVDPEEFKSALPGSFAPPAKPANP